MSTAVRTNNTRQMPPDTRLLPISGIRPQDDVDNLIHALIEDISGKRQDWNIKIIGDLRDGVLSVLEMHGVICAENIYPALAVEEYEEFSPVNLREGVRLSIAAVKQNPTDFLIEAGAVVIVFLFLLYGLHLIVGSLN